MEDVANAVIESNDVYGNARDGIEVMGEGADPVIRGNQVHDGEAHGIAVFDGASPFVESNDVHGNGWAGIDVEGAGSNVIVRDNRVSR